MSKMKYFLDADPEKCSLEGPYQYPKCGGHLKIDSTFLEQVQSDVICPYCGITAKVPE